VSEALNRGQPRLKAGKGLRGELYLDILDKLFSHRPKGGIRRLTRKEKEKEVAWLHEQFMEAKALFLTNFHGLSVEEMNSLRTQLRTGDSTFKVLKNTLVSRASKDTDVAEIVDDMVGPRAAAWTTEDDGIPAMAKILIEFSKKNPKLELVSGVYDGKRIELGEMEAISKLPSKEELLGMLLGTMIAPLGALVGTLAAVPRSFLNVLKAIENEKTASSEPAAG
jgi:large subunit ribosomal protein L10